MTISLHFALASALRLCPEASLNRNIYGFVLSSSLCGGFEWVLFGSRCWIKSNQRGGHVCKILCFVLSCIILKRSYFDSVTTRVVLVNGRKNGIGLHKGLHIVKIFVATCTSLFDLCSVKSWLKGVTSARYSIILRYYFTLFLHTLVPETYILNDW